MNINTSPGKQKSHFAPHDGPVTSKGWPGSQRTGRAGQSVHFSILIHTIRPITVLMFGLSLTTGWLDAALSGRNETDSSGIRPILQVIDAFVTNPSKFPGQMSAAATSPLFRLVVSDGLRKCKVVLSPSLNHFIHQLKFAVVRINSFNLVSLPTSSPTRCVFCAIQLESPIS